GDRFADRSPVKAENHVGVRRDQICAFVVGIIQGSTSRSVKSFEPCRGAIRNRVRFGRRAHLTLVVVAKGDALRLRLSRDVKTGLIALDVRPVKLAVSHTVGVRCETDTGMMHGSSNAGTYFDAGHPRILLEWVRQHQDHVLDPAFRRHCKRRRFYHNVRLGTPAVHPLDGRWSIFGASYNRPAVGPSDDRVDFSLRQRVVVDEMPILGIQTSGGHPSLEDGAFHRPGPRTGAFVAQEGHRRHFTGPVAALTSGLQDGENVLIKSYVLAK